MSTLSTATTHDHESPSTPTYPNGEPILYTGNPAELTGILEALIEHFVNNGMFQPLLTHGAVLLRNGKVAVDSFTTATFLTDSTYKAGVGSFAEPYDGEAAWSSWISFRRRACSWLGRDRRRSRHRR